LVELRVDGRLAARDVDVIADLVELREDLLTLLVALDLLGDLLLAVLLGRVPVTLRRIGAEHAADIALRPDRDVRHAGSAPPRRAGARCPSRRGPSPRRPQRARSRRGKDTPRTVPGPGAR